MAAACFGAASREPVHLAGELIDGIGSVRARLFTHDATRSGGS